MDLRLSHRAWIFLALLYQWWPALASASDCDLAVAKLASVEGQVEVRDSGGTTWHKAQLEESLCPGDTVKLGASSRAAVVLSNHTLVRLDALTTLTITGPGEEDSFWVELLRGITHFMSRVPRKLKVTTPFVNAGVDGTEFLVRVDEAESFLSVFEGLVSLDNEEGTLSLASGESAVARKGEAPVTQVVVRPGDAVQWALYYPPIIDPYRPGAEVEDAANGAVRESLKLFARGDLQGALTRLEEVPIGLRDAGYYTYRGSLLLYVGRVAEAEADIQQALAQNPTDAGALSLSSIIALTQNDREEALRIASEAVQLQPGMAAPHIALSYAQQSKFDLEAALASAQRAAELAPKNALAWARIAELELSHGFLRRAVESAEKSTSLSPDLARTQWILGFSYLTQIRVKKAVPAFETAIALNPADPMARLGLGLAKIRQGKLEEGRRDIEIAAILNPSDSIIRSYLGKAYFEEKRNKLASTEYDFAKTLDPKDPTPWFYNAIRLQTENKPVEALNNLQESIELNDNRAVYRSSLLLDQDEASRSASLARIYTDLGFEQRALVEGWHAINTDPANFSAHRFLADTYSALPRHEIARVSELLLSQLLQPLNTTPIQPQLAEASLGILDGTGPSSLSFLEFNPLFTRNSVGVQFNGVAGNNSTLGNDLTVSGVYDRVSYSLGQFHYETDGFRENNDFDQDIYSAFIQGSLSHATSIQAEVRRREYESGDLSLRFDPDIFFPNRRTERKRNMERLGLRHKLTARSDLLVSASHQDLSIKQNETEFEKVDVPFPSTRDFKDTNTLDSEAYTVELQHLGYSSWANYVVGGGFHDEDRRDTDRTLEVIDAPILFPEPLVTVDSFDTEQVDSEYTNAYIYSYTKLPRRLTLILGGAYYSMDSSDFGIDEIDPKLGVTWGIPSDTMVRLAYFEGVGRPLNAEQTVEPTQVAGFSQFYDDPPGSKTRRYGFAIDQHFTRGLFAGIELSWRDIDDAPVVGTALTTDFDEREEQFHRVYANWTPAKPLAFSSDYFFEKQEGEIIRPQKLDTHRAQLGVRYSSASGARILVNGNYVDQEITQFDSTDNDEFWIVDTAVGYRFPRRLGIASLVIKNLLDEKFRYFDLNTTQGLARGARTPTFIPERQIFVQFTLAYN